MAVQDVVGGRYGCLPWLKVHREGGKKRIVGVAVLPIVIVLRPFAAFAVALSIRYKLVHALAEGDGGERASGPQTKQRAPFQSYHGRHARCISFAFCCRRAMGVCLAPPPSTAGNCCGLCIASLLRKV